MERFNISEEECCPLLKKARLYSGFDDLVRLAEAYGLTLTDYTMYEPESSHHRILYIFQKG